MVLLTMTPAIVEGLHSVEKYRLATTDAISSGHAHGDEALAPGCNEPNTLEDETQDARKEEKTCTEDISSDQNTSLESLSNEPSLQDPKPGNPISHLQVIALSSQLKTTSTIPSHLDALLRGSNVYVPPPPPKPEPTSEYKALMARLRREAEEREYIQLTKPAPTGERFSRNLPASSPAFAFSSTEAYIEASPDDDITYDDVSRQLTLILNVVISIIACSAALWMVSKWWSTPARLALSMGGSIVVAVAEVGVYFGFIRKVKESVKEEKAVEEVKELVNTWVVTPGEKNADQIPDKKGVTLLKEKDNEAVRRRTTNTTRNQPESIS